MNPNLELKFMRSIFSNHFTPKKVILLDNYWYNKELPIEDEDCKSIFDISTEIKKENFLFSKPVIKDFYYKLLPSVKKIIINDDEIDKMIEYVEKHSDINSIMKYFFKSKIFDELNFEICSIIINIFYLKDAKGFIAIHPAWAKDLEDAIIRDDELKLNDIIDKIINHNNEFNIKKRKYEIHEIIECVDSIPADTLSFFGIQEVYIFGSYAKKRNTEYSDLDLHIISSIQGLKKQQQDTLSAYFSWLLKINVDVKVTYLNTRIPTSIQEVLIGEIRIK